MIELITSGAIRFVVDGVRYDAIGELVMAPWGKTDDGYFLLAPQALIRAGEKTLIPLGEMDVVYAALWKMASESGTVSLKWAE